jgi:hypothetical protein
MKKILIIIALVALPIASYGQSIFDTLEDMDGVSSVIISKDAFEILSKFKSDKSDDGNEVMEFFNMIHNLNELKMFSTDNSSVASKMESMVKTSVKRSKLTELMRIKDKDSRVKIYVKAGKNKDYVSEVLMFVKEMNKHSNGKVSSVIVSLTGMIDINKLSKIADTVTNKAK